MSEEDKWITLLPHSQVEPRLSDSVPVSGTVRGPGMEVAFSLPKLLEVLPLSVVVIDDQMRILLANSAARQLLCPGSQAFIGYSLHRFLSPTRLGQACAALEHAAAQQNERAIGEREGIPPQVFRDRVFISGLQHDLEVSAGAFLTSGRRYFVLTLTDQTAAQKWGEEEAGVQGPDSARSMERLERSHQLEALGHLAGTFAHDFNNLLSVILGSLQAAERRVRAGEDPSAEIQRAMTATTRSIQTTSRVLHYTRTRSDTVETSSPAQALEELRTLLEHAVGRGVRLNIHVTETPNVAVSAAQLETAVLNLVINARDAVGEVGIIDVELQERRISEEDSLALGVLPGLYVSILVCDSGVGMNEDVKRRAFEPFYTTKPEGSGTGLGLSTVRSLMTKMGGAVLLDSASGEGTCIELLLPSV